MIYQRHFRVLGGSLLIGFAILLVVGCAGVRSEAPHGQQSYTEATKEQTYSDRCEGTRSIDLQGESYVTNDLPGCPKGDLLLGTEKDDKLDGEDGDDEVRGLGGSDALYGGSGSDVIYGGPGDDGLHGDFFCCSQYDQSKDVLYGGPGKDSLEDFDGGDDVLHGGDGDDVHLVGGKGEDVIHGGMATITLTGPQLTSLEL